MEPPPSLCRRFGIPCLRKQQRHNWRQSAEPPTALVCEHNRENCHMPAGDSESAAQRGGRLHPRIAIPSSSHRTHHKNGGSSRNCRYLLCGAVRNTTSLQVPASTRPRVPGTLHLAARSKRGGTLSLFVYISLPDRG